MNPPKKLKILLLIWTIYLVLSLIIPIVLVFEFMKDAIFGSLTNGLVVLYAIIFIVVFALQIAFIKHLRKLWKGTTSNDLFLRVMAGLQLLSFPFGTALGVGTYIILHDIEVRTYLNHGVAPMTKEKLLADIEELKHGNSR